MAETGEWVEINLIYAGRRVAAGNKLKYLFHEDAGDRAVFDKAMSQPVVGGIYKVERNGDSFRIRSGRYDGMSEDSRIQEWRLEDRAANLEIERHRAVRRALKEGNDFGDLTLKQVRGMMVGGLAHHHYGMLAQVIAYLEGG